jgi:hypothetical protein
MSLRNCGVIMEPTGFGKGKSILASLIDPTALEGGNLGGQARGHVRDRAATNKSTVETVAWV